MPLNTFPKNHRLLSKKDFDSLKERSRRVVHTNAIFYFSKDSTAYPHTRIGISASKKTGNAVVRNRLKRIIREFFRTSEYKNIGKDVLIVLKRGRKTKLEEYETNLLLDLDKGFIDIGKYNAN